MKNDELIAAQQGSGAERNANSRGRGSIQTITGLSLRMDVVLAYSYPGTRLPPPPRVPWGIPKFVITFEVDSHIFNLPPKSSRRSHQIKEVVMHIMKKQNKLQINRRLCTTTRRRRENTTTSPKCTGRNLRCGCQLTAENAGIQKT